MSFFLLQICAWVLLVQLIAVTSSARDINHSQPRWFSGGHTKSIGKPIIIKLKPSQPSHQSYYQPHYYAPPPPPPPPPYYYPPYYQPQQQQQLQQQQQQQSGGSPYIIIVNPTNRNDHDIIDTNKNTNNPTTNNNDNNNMGLNNNNNNDQNNNNNNDQNNNNNNDNNDNNLQSNNNNNNNNGTRSLNTRNTFRVSGSPGSSTRITQISNDKEETILTSKFNGRPATIQIFRAYDTPQDDDDEDGDYIDSFRALEADSEDSKSQILNNDLLDLILNINRNNRVYAI